MGACARLALLMAISACTLASLSVGQDIFVTSQYEIQPFKPEQFVKSSAGLQRFGCLGPVKTIGHSPASLFSANFGVFTRNGNVTDIRMEPAGHAHLVRVCGPKMDQVS